MTSVAEHAEIIRRRLYGGGLGRYNFLLAHMSETTDTITLADDPTNSGLVTGTRIGIGTEIMLVRPAPDLTAKTAPVRRGFLGTTAAVHEIGDVVEIAPRFPLGDIVDTMREEIDGWDDRVFRVETQTLSLASDRRAYDLVNAIEPLFLLEVSAANDTVTDRMRNSKTPVSSLLLRDQDLTEFPSGFALQVKDYPRSGANLQVTWAERFNTDEWELDTELEDDIGLDRNMLDIITYGTMWRIMSGREIARTDMHAAGETRRDESTPPGHQSRVASELLVIRDRRLAVAANHLRGRYPYRIS